MALIIYIARVRPDVGAYSATFPDFPGLELRRETIPQLLQAGREQLLQGLHETEQLQGEWPTPTLVAALKTAPGEVLLAVDVQVDDTPTRINISLGEHLLKRLDEAAQHESMSRSGYIAAAVRERLQRSAGRGGSDDAAQRLYQDIITVGRRVHETLGPDSPIGRTLTDLDNRALDGLRRLADGVGAAMQLRPRDSDPTRERPEAAARPGDTHHPDVRDDSASPDNGPHKGDER